METTLKKSLFDSYQLGDLTLENRVVLAPMTRARSGPDRVPNERMATYYGQRATAGLLITEATVISEQGIGWVETPGIYRADQVEGWKLVTQRVHELGTPIFMQLWHMGRASHSDFLNGEAPVSASPVKINGDKIHTPNGKKDYQTPRSLTTEEVQQVVNDYQRAASLAKEAGFDGVEIHAANGYLIDQFLQSKTNLRTDQYGGSVEKRYQFLKEIVEGVLEVYDASRVAVRISPNGNFNDMGSADYREAFTHIIRSLESYGLAYLHVMDGLGFGFHELGESWTLEQVRELYSGTVMGNTGYDKQSAENRIAEGGADLIAFGRPYISNPDLVERYQNGWPLNPDAPMETWYSPGEKGYIDFPRYQAS
jgi:N-ethylmaleimide reductase